MLAHSSSLFRSLWMVTLPSSISAGHHSLSCPTFWCHLWTWQVQSVMSSSFLIKMLNRTSPSTVHCSSTLVNSYQVTYMLLASAFRAWTSNLVDCYNHLTRTRAPFKRISSSPHHCCVHNCTVTQPWKAKEKNEKYCHTRYPMVWCSLCPSRPEFSPCKAYDNFLVMPLW